MNPFRAIWPVCRVAETLHTHTHTHTQTRTHAPLKMMRKEFRFDKIHSIVSVINEQEGMILVFLTFRSVAAGRGGRIFYLACRPHLSSY